MALPGGPNDDSVIDLIDSTSDSEEDGGEFASMDFYSDAALTSGSNDAEDNERFLVDFLGPDNNEAADLIDPTSLEDIPDIDVPPDGAPPSSSAVDATVVGDVSCLQMIVNVFPDIAVNYVLELIDERSVRTVADCERLITQLLDGGYQKESDEVNRRKRKRSNEVPDDDIAEFENGGQEKQSLDYHQHALGLLKDEFLEIPVRHIENTLHQKKTLFYTYATLEDQLRSYNRISSMFSKIGRPRLRQGYEDRRVAAASDGNQLLKELRAAKKKSEQEAAKRRKDEDEKQAEEANVVQAQINGEMGECLCCFDDKPINRMVCCSGESVHFVCQGCAKRYVEEEIGKMRCRPKCFADTACEGTFTRKQLMGFLDEKTFERLEHLQQQEELRLAGIDALEECPFCDYKAEYPAIEIDKEFRCLAPKCGKTSCRICRKETHVPMSCDEARKDESLSVRHQVEEAKSAALIRTCNRCKNPFVKEYGCNKMTCSKCGNMQCYVCSKNVTNYNHFGNARCPLHDNHEDRHEQEIEKAEKEVLAKIRAERPDISEEELKIEVSDRIKREEKDRRGRVQAQHDGFGFHMDGDNLVARPLRQPPFPVHRQPPFPAHMFAPLQPAINAFRQFEWFRNPPPAQAQAPVPAGFNNGAPAPRHREYGAVPFLAAPAPPPPFPLENQRPEGFQVFFHAMQDQEQLLQNQMQAMYNDIQLQQPDQINMPDLQQLDGHNQRMQQLRHQHQRRLERVFPENLRRRGG